MMKENKSNIFPWIVMLSLGLISAACLGSSMVLMGSFLTPISKSMGVPVSVTSYYYTVIVLVMAVMMPVVPKILAKVNNTLVYLIASVLVTASLLLIGHFTQIWMFFLIAIVIGVCISFMSFVPVGIVVDNWFSDKTNFAIGVCWAVTSIYQGIMSPLLASWIGSMGWQSALNIMAIIVGVLSIPFAFLVHFSPEQVGKKPYGYEKQVKKSNNNETEDVESAPTHSIVTSKAFWILMILLCLFQFPAVLNQMFPTYAISAGFAETAGGFMVTAAMIFDIFLNPIIGATFDKIGASKGSILWLIVGLISYSLLIFATNTHSAGLAIFSAGINDVVYVFLGTGITAIASAFLGKRAFAKGFSYVSSVSFVIGAFAMPLNNFIAEKFNGFNAVYIFFAILILLTIILIAYGSKNTFDDQYRNKL